MVATGMVTELVAPGVLGESPRSLGVLVIAGLLVGFGTRLGNGCTSGHGVCGVSRGSWGSIGATAVFVVVGAVTATLVAALGGRP